MTHTHMRFAWMLLAFGSAPLVAFTNQSAPAATQSLPQFEVASIKPNKSAENRVMLGIQPGGRFTATNVTLRMLIRNAYQLQEFQITGGPSWIADDRFDIVAKAESGDGIGDPFRAEPNGQPSRGQLMIRALLAERFKLVVHNEDKEMPIYALVLARSDGKLGPKLKVSETDCAAMMAAARGRGRGLMPPPGPPQAGAPMQCGIRIGPGNMAVGGSPMTQIATSLAMFAGRIVVDKTGLAGNYDFTLSWTPDQMPGAGQRPPGAPEPPPIDPNGPSLFTAVQEQLGLKLDSQRGPVAMLVIDRAERPTEN
jgi:bla regulator protein blaR1